MMALDTRDTLVGTHAGCWRAALAALGVVAFACSGPPKQTNPPPPPPLDRMTDAAPPADSREPDLPVRATGSGDSREAARADALAALAATLLTEQGAAWAAHAGIPVHDPSRDYIRAETGEGGVIEVVVGLSVPRAAEILGALDEHAWQTRAPAPLAPVLVEAMAAHTDALVCARKQALAIDEGCAPPALEPLIERVAAVANGVRLRSYFQDGVPVTADARPLRPMLVVVENRAGDAPADQWIPFAGVPVTVLVPADRSALDGTSALSGDSGLAIFSFVDGARWPQAFEIAIDREAMLGPFSFLWPDARVTIEGRPVGTKRWTLIASERARGRVVDDGVFKSALTAAMNAGGARFVRIKKPVAENLMSLDQAKRAKRLPGLADIWEGTIDMVVVSKTESTFASSMGAHRVWYEAKGEISVYNAWTGEETKVLTPSVTSHGVGDENAAKQAREDLARKLSEQLLAL